VSEDHLALIVTSMRWCNTDLAEAPPVQLSGEARKLGLTEEQGQELLDQVFFPPDDECSSIKNPGDANILWATSWRSELLVHVHQHEHELQDVGTMRLVFSLEPAYSFGSAMAIHDDNIMEDLPFQGM
jgi:hypothetical protein